MSTKSSTLRTETPAGAPRRSPAAATPTGAKVGRVTKADTLIALMRSADGATAQALAEAVGWQVHSVRGFIAGTLKKRPDLSVSSDRKDGATRYRITDAASDQS